MSNSPLEAILGKDVQAGMGAHMSNWCTGRAIGQDGRFTPIVSGIALDLVLARELQDGDLTGDIRKALNAFQEIYDVPDEFVQEVLDEYFLEDGRQGENYKHMSPPKFTQTPNPDDSTKQILTLDNTREKLLVLGGFVEVYRAKQGHDSPIGVNFLNKIAWPLLPGVYGVMLAEAYFVAIGAGFKKGIPQALDNLSKGEVASLPFDVIQDDTGEINTNYSFAFDPSVVMGRTVKSTRPGYIAIIGNHLGLNKTSDADGLVFEMPPAGGHNAPARVREPCPNNEPAYSHKDEIDWSKTSKKIDDRPFWLAGGSAERRTEALYRGAQGTQVGTAFAFCADETGMDSDLRDKALEAIMNGAYVLTDPNISPSGFPFKVLMLDGTIADDDVGGVRSNRQRRCDLQYLVDFYINEDGDKVKMRCPAEPVKSYVEKGGSQQNAIDRACLCNALMSTVKFPSIMPNGELEPPVITAGKDLSLVRELVIRYGDPTNGNYDYSAKQVIDSLEQKNK